MANAAEELDLVPLYLLPPATAVTPLPAGEIPVNILREETETRWDAVYQGNLGGTMGLTRRRKSKPQKTPPSLYDELGVI